MARYEKMMIKLLFILHNCLCVDMELQVEGSTVCSGHDPLSILEVRPVVMAGDRNVETVIEGSSFTLECHVSVPVTIDNSVTIMWKQEDLVLQADTVRVRHDPNMNITFLKKTSTDMSQTHYSTYLRVEAAEKSYQGEFGLTYSLPNR